MQRAPITQSYVYEYSPQGSTLLTGSSVADPYGSSVYCTFGSTLKNCPVCGS